MTRNMSTAHIPSLIQSYLPEALHPFITLSYRIPNIEHPFKILPCPPPTFSQLYGKGPKDVLFVIFCAFAFTLAREITMKYVFSAGVRMYLGGGEKTKDGKRRLTKKEKRRVEHVILRFSEQGWSFLYCSVFWSLGMFILYQLPAPFSAESLWGSYPVTTLPPLTKFYYLAQLGWWFHQIYVINSEKRRSDHWQMFGHHIISIALITSSYLAHFTRVGTVIHVLMDLCDILLPLAKMIRYLQFLTLCDLCFVAFMISWLFTRQIGLALVIRSIYYEAPKYIPLIWDPSHDRFFSKPAYYGFLGTLSLLYCLASVWFYMAIKVCIRVIRGLGAEDSRSDDEDEPTPEPEQQIDKVADPHAHSTAVKLNGNGHLDGADVTKRR